MNFDVLHAATNNRYVDNDDIWLINLAVIASFRNFRLTTSSGKHLVKIDHAHIVSLMYKLLTSSRGSDDLSICFDRDHNRRKRELSKKNIKGKYHVRIYLKDIFGFSEDQLKANYGLGFKLILTGNSDNAVLNKNNATAIGKIKINSIDWYVLHYTPSIDQERVLTKQIVDKIPTELKYVEGNDFMEEMDTQNLWTFELGTQERINFPKWIIIGFQQKERQDSQNLAHDTFYEPTVTSAQCIIGTEKNLIPLFC